MLVCRRRWRRPRLPGEARCFFPRGTYFLTQPLVVPPGTVLAGEREDLVALYFAEANVTTAPAFYIGMNDTAAKEATGSGRYASVRCGGVVLWCCVVCVLGACLTRGTSLPRAWSLSEAARAWC